MSPNDFSGDLHRRAIEAICSIYLAQAEVRLSHLLPLFSVEEYDHIAAMLAAQNEMPSHPDTLAQTIATLQKYQNRHGVEVFATMSAVEIQQRYQQKKGGEAALAGALSPLKDGQDPKGPKDLPHN